MSLSENSPSTEPVLEKGTVAPVIMDNNFLSVKMMTTRLSIDSGIGNISIWILNNKLSEI